MLNTTVPFLMCPKKKRGKLSCGGALFLTSERKIAGPTQNVFEVTSGHLDCQTCRSRYPILGGVAIIVEDVLGYLLAHVKGISQRVSDEEIPAELLEPYLEAKAEIQQEHIEEDLEAERVIALYVMNHYLRTEGSDPWWRPLSHPQLSKDDPGSEVIDALMKRYWDHGPFEKISEWVKDLGQAPFSLVELGCGVAGLYRTLNSHRLLKSYLGVDSSFASVAVGRHLALGVPLQGKVLFPEDLLKGAVSRKIQLPKPTVFDGTGDLIVGDLERLPLVAELWDLSVALNTIDMLDEPALLPQTQYSLLRKGGAAIQSCPYVWAESVAKRLRARVPKSSQSSALAVEWIYQQAGFSVDRTVEHLPWLFFKHLRQLELYSVHLFLASKPGSARLEE